MIFNVLGHIEMIRNGLPRIEPCKPILIKTETRRPKRGIYQIETERKKAHKTGYAVQRKRAVKAESDIRIIFNRIWEEKPQGFLVAEDDKMYPGEMTISRKDAWAEGGYTPREYEAVWAKLNPKWDGWSRWAFEFYVVEVRNNVPGITAHAREERVKRIFLSKEEKEIYRKFDHAQKELDKEVQR